MAASSRGLMMTGVSLSLSCGATRHASMPPTITILSCTCFRPRERGLHLRQRVRVHEERQLAIEDRHHRFPAQVGFEVGRRRLARLPIGAGNLKRIANCLLRLVDFLLLIFRRLRVRAGRDQSAGPASAGASRRARARHLCRRPAIHAETAELPERRPPSGTASTVRMPLLRATGSSSLSGLMLVMLLAFGLIAPALGDVDGRPHGADLRQAQDRVGADQAGINMIAGGLDHLRAGRNRGVGRPTAVIFPPSKTITPVGDFGAAHRMNRRALDRNRTSSGAGRGCSIRGLRANSSRSARARTQRGGTEYCAAALTVIHRCRNELPRRCHRAASGRACDPHARGRFGPLSSGFLSSPSGLPSSFTRSASAFCTSASRCTAKVFRASRSSARSKYFRPSIQVCSTRA